MPSNRQYSGAGRITVNSEHPEGVRRWVDTISEYLPTRAANLHAKPPVVHANASGVCHFGDDIIDCDARIAISKRNAPASPRWAGKAPY